MLFYYFFSLTWTHYEILKILQRGEKRKRDEKIHKVKRPLFLRIKASSASHFAVFFNQRKLNSSYMLSIYSCLQLYIYIQGLQASCKGDAPLLMHWKMLYVQRNFFSKYHKFQLDIETSKAHVLNNWPF